MADKVRTAKSAAEQAVRIGKNVPIRAQGGARRGLSGLPVPALFWIGNFGFAPTNLNETNAGRG
jgi:hypothetical protein